MSEARPRDLPGRLQIDDQLELGRLLDREVAGFCAPQDPIDVPRGARNRLRCILDIPDQSARLEQRRTMQRVGNRFRAA